MRVGDNAFPSIFTSAESWFEAAQVLLPIHGRILRLQASEELSIFSIFAYLLLIVFSALECPNSFLRQNIDGARIFRLEIDNGNPSIISEICPPAVYHIYRLK